jgi:hypothetical protein
LHNAVAAPATDYIRVVSKFRLIAIQIDGSAGAAGSVTVGISINGTTYDNIYTSPLTAGSVDVIHIVDQPVQTIRIVASPTSGTCSVWYSLGDGF